MAIVRRLGWFASLGSVVLLCRPLPKPAPAGPPAERPALVVLVTIDQMRTDYLDRWKDQLTGGLARIVRTGAWYVEAHHDHAITETAPGHASLLSGRFPRSTGITRNLAGVNDRQWRLFGTRELGAAPFRFRGTTLFDWLHAVDSGSRALSVSAKDRSAILPVGRAKENVYWFANNGTFTTSIWYRDTLPEWVTAFNARRIPHSYAGRSWDLLLDPTAYREPDTVRFEAGGRNVTFPHVLPADSVRAAVQFRFTPMMDELTAAFALEGVRRLEIGKGPSTDLLAVSFSATDYVGHYYGPESREQHDQIIRLDRVLGGFLDTLFAIRDSSRIVLVLTADHGAGFIPELHGGHRVNTDAPMALARVAVVRQGGDSGAVDIESGAFFVDRALAKSDAAVDSATEAFIAAAKTLPGVLRVDRWADLVRKGPGKDEIGRRWLQMFPDDLRPMAVVTVEPKSMFDYPVIATHGSPHRHDSHVPLIFWGAPFRAGRYRPFVRTVDIGPTLARVLGIAPTEPLDGRPLTEALR